MIVKSYRNLLRHHGLFTLSSAFVTYDVTIVCITFATYVTFAVSVSEQKKSADENNLGSIHSTDENNQLK